MTRFTFLLAKAKRYVLCLAVLSLFGASVTPAPAYAVEVFDPFFEAVQETTSALEKAKIVLNNTELGANIMAITTYITTQYNNYIKYFGTMTQNGQAALAGQQVEAKGIEKLTTYMMDVNTKNKLLETQMRIASDLAPPKHEHLCRAILVNGGASTSEYFDKELSRMLAEAVSNKDRCATCNGMGGDYYATYAERVKDQKTGSPLDSPASEVDSTTVLSGGATRHDSSISGIHIATYEVPIFIRKTYTDPLSGASVSVVGPDMKNLSAEQKEFVSKWDYIFNVVGPRPTPVSGNALKSETGRRQRAMFNHCLANQNALVKQMTDWLAYLTRPNYKDSNWDEYRKAQYKVCQSAKGSVFMGIDSEGEIHYGNCDGSLSEFRGLSTYELELLAIEMCKSNHYSVAMVADGSGTASPLETSDLCSTAWEAFQGEVMRREMNYLAASQSMKSLDTCWAAVSNAAKGYASLNKKGEGVQPSLVDYEGAAPSEDPVAVQRINFNVDPSFVPKGRPVSFDEIKQPASVGQ
ncbi:MAG: hypothetical protein PHW63_03315 [Alphaproteobacteria bacterium]|nr:hypothetical protein [Alphaproteobacteria bacterium]